MEIILIIVGVLSLGSAIIAAPFILSSRMSKDDEERRDIPREIPADSKRMPSTPPPPEVEIKLEVLRAKSKPSRTISGVTVKDGIGKGSDKRTGTDGDPFED